MLDNVNRKSTPEASSTPYRRPEQPDAFLPMDGNYLSARKILAGDVLGYRREAGELIEGKVYVVRVAATAEPDVLLYLNGCFSTAGVDPTLDWCLPAEGMIVDGIVISIWRDC